MIPYTESILRLVATPNFNFWSKAISIFKRKIPMEKTTHCSAIFNWFEEKNPGLLYLDLYDPLNTFIFRVCKQ